MVPWHQGVHGASLVPTLKPCWLIRWLQQVSEVLLNFKYIHISLTKGFVLSLEVSNFRWLCNTSQIFSKKNRAVTQKGKFLGAWSTAELRNTCDSMEQMTCHCMMGISLAQNWANFILLKERVAVTSKKTLNALLPYSICLFNKSRRSL